MQPLLCRLPVCSCLPQLLRELSLVIRQGTDERAVGRVQRVAQPYSRQTRD
jgi:hypothetical protein